MIKVQNIWQTKKGYLQYLQYSLAISSREGIMASSVTISPSIEVYAILIGFEVVVNPIHKSMGYVSTLRMNDRRLGSKYESSISEVERMPTWCNLAALSWLWLNLSDIGNDVLEKNPETWPSGKFHFGAIDRGTTPNSDIVSKPLSRVNFKNNKI